MLLCIVAIKTKPWGSVNVTPKRKRRINVPLDSIRFKEQKAGVNLCTRTTVFCSLFIGIKRSCA